MKKPKDGDKIGEYNSIPIICKYDCPPNTLYFINTDILEEEKRIYPKKSLKQLVKSTRKYHGKLVIPPERKQG